MGSLPYVIGSNEVAASSVFAASQVSPRTTENFPEETGRRLGWSTDAGAS